MSRASAAPLHPALVGLLVLPLAAGAGACSEAVPAPPNLLVVSIDTCRADHLSVYGYGRATSPALEALAARGVVFDRAYAQVPDTTPSHASLFTAVHPAVHGSANGVPLDEGATTLAELLRDAGYRTAGFVSSATMSRRQSGLAQGFETYDDALTHDPQGVGRAVERRAGETTERALAWLDGAGGEPFFLFVHYFDAHTRYDPPSPYDELFLGDLPEPDPIPEERIPPYARLGDATDLEHYKALYDGELRYVDDQLGRLIGALDARGLDDDTLVVVTSDHGEDMGEHGVYFSHGWTLFDPALHVPLVFRYPPGLPAGRRVEALARSTDVMPTILELLDVGFDGPVQGASRVAEMRGAPATGELTALAKTTKTKTYLKLDVDRDIEDLWALRSGDWKLLSSDDGERRALFHVATDPGEAEDLIERRRAEARLMIDELDRARAELAERRGGVVPLDGEELEAARRELQALGYVR